MALSAPNELTQEQVQKLLVQPLEAASVFLASGPRIFDTNGSSVRVPKQAGATAPSWHGQNEQIDEVNPDFEEITLLPDSMESVKVLVKFSNELARQSIVSLDAALRDRLVRDVAATLDSELLAGTDTTGVRPLGLENYVGRQILDVDPDAITLDDLHDAEGLALGANVNPQALRWFMPSDQFIAFRKIKQATGSNNYVVQPDVTAAGAYTLMGHSVTVTNRVNKVILADMSQVAVARDLAPTVKILDQTFGDYDQQAIRVVARYDAQPLNAEAVITLEEDPGDGEGE